MRRGRRPSNYKFTEKTHSFRGGVAGILALLSLLAGVCMVMVSYLNKGNGTIYLGSGGILAFIVAIVAFVLAFVSIREENSYKGIPTIALILGTVALVGWLAIYMMGFFGI